MGLLLDAPCPSLLWAFLLSFSSFHFWAHCAALTLVFMFQSWLIFLLDPEIVCTSPMLTLLKEQKLLFSTYSIYLYKVMMWSFFKHRIFLSAALWFHLQWNYYTVLKRNHITLILTSCQIGLTNDPFMTLFSFDPVILEGKKGLIQLTNFLPIWNFS